MKWLVNLKVTKKKNAALRLSISSAISQLVTFIFLPILTHIYSPAEYGKLTLIISASAVVISISTLRFETIFMGTKDISDSNNLIKSMVFISLLTSLVSLPIAYIGQYYFLKSSNILFISVLFSNIVLVQAFIVIFTQISLKEKKYNQIERSGPLQNISTTILQFLSGLVKPAGESLILCSIIGRYLGLIPLLKIVKSQLVSSHINRSKTVIKKNLSVSKFLVLASIIENFTAFMPVFFISIYFGLTTAGYVGVVQSILLAPAILIGSSFASILFSEYSNISNDSLDPKANRFEMLSLLKTLVVISSLITLFLVIFGSKILNLVINVNWQESSNLITWLAIPYSVNILWKPIVNILYLEKKWKVYLQFTIINCLLSSVFGGFALFFGYGWKATVFSFICGQAISQLMAILYVYKKLLLIH